MARGDFRRGGYRGGHRGSPRNQGARFMPGRNANRNTLLGIGQPIGFTLADEARSTVHAQSTWNTDSRLRSRPVQFVSAGSIDPMKLLEEQLSRKATETLDQFSQDVDRNDAANNDAALERWNSVSTVSIEAGIVESEAAPEVDVGDTFSNDTEAAVVEAVEVLTLHDTQSPTEDERMQDIVSSNPTVDIDANPVTPQAATGTEPAEPAAHDSSEPLFFIDTAGDANNRSIKTHTKGSNKSREVEDDINTDSSEEIILFKGRNHIRSQGQRLSRKQSTNTFESSISSGKRDMDVQTQMDAQTTSSHVLLKSATPADTLGRAPPRKEKKKEKKENKKKRKKRKSQPNYTNDEKKVNQLDDEAALVADYIANMREHGDDKDLITHKRHSHRDIGGSDMDMDVGDGSSEALDDRNIPRPELEQNASQTASEDMDNDSAAEGLPVVHFLSSTTEAAAADSGTKDPFPWDPDMNDGDDDCFDAYDFMDWGKPITKYSRKSKGKTPQFDISDSELEAELQAAFKKDRLKKSEKKKEREKLRAQGLVGKNIKPDDLRVKYQEGMHLEQIAEELRIFLMGEQSSLTLPPMDNHARKVIHELANKFNIKSKSTGSGDQRRPTLYRTLRTFKYSADAFDSAIARVGRKYFPRKDRLPTGPPRQPRHGTGHAAISYKDGEVVGGSAPEIGDENRGRAMLEKMGWSSGTALGAMSNKGILMPVEQKVKRGKAGLG